MTKRRGIQLPPKSNMVSSSSDSKYDVIKDVTKKGKLEPISRPLAEETFVRWQQFIEQEVGFVLPKNQTHWLWHAVNRLAEDEQTTQIDLLAKVAQDKVLKQKIIDAVLIPQSRFFRHRPSIDFILEQAKLLNKKIMVWSVGCSHGQEVWSIAMALSNQKSPYRVWGSDVNESALKHAKRALYDNKQLNEIPIEYKKYALIQGNRWAVSDELRNNVEFLKYNLFAIELPSLPPMNIIICQNVLIYFRQFDQRDILSRLITKLDIGGCLVLSPGEASQWRHPQMKKLPNLQINAWQKIK